MSKVGQGYSESNPVPTIQNYEEQRARMEADAQAEAEAEANSAGEHPSVRTASSPASSTAGLIDKPLPTPGVRDSRPFTDSPGGGEKEGNQPSPKQNEKQELMNRMAGPPEKPTDKVKKAKGSRVVKDPTTGMDVTIRDANFKDYPNVKQLAPEYEDDVGTSMSSPTSPSSGKFKHGRSGSTSSAGSGPAKKFKKGLTGVTGIFHGNHSEPNAARPGNISLLPYPPPAPASLKPIMQLLDQLQLAIVATCAILWFFTAFGSGFWRFAFRSVLIGTAGFGVVTFASIAQRKVEKEIERVRVDMHRARGEKFAAPTPESVEWLNAFIKTFWGIVNPDMFVPIADMVEDVMQQSLPKFVDAVRISGIGQGSNPFRVVSMRALPDQPTDKEYPREEWIDQGTNDIMQQREKLEKEGKDADQTGDYVNFEVAFAYQALPGQGDDLRAKNIHLLIEFFLGVFDWIHIPIPIWIQVEGIVGTVRLRMQFIPEFPYVRNLTFTLMGVPAVEVSAIPMMKQLPNVLDLPLISRFVKMAISAGTAELVAPKSMTLNIQEMLNEAVIGDTRAIGVFIIRIRYAEDLSAQDSNGRSDPYIVLAYAKFGKPLYSTRIVLGDLNPVYEETAFLLLTNDEIKADEDLSAMLWDSDKRSADDLIGRVKIPVKELIAKPNQMIDRTDKLAGFEDADTMQGSLHWSIGYFEKAPLRKDLERPPENPPAVPPKTAPEMEMRPGDKAPNPGARSLPPPPADVRRTPPDPDYPSGVLSVIVHQINNLERQNLKGTGGSDKDREGQAGQDTDDPNEQAGNLPSAYCELVINDDLVYKTRVKQYTSMPFFEAGTETFIRDWKKAVVRVVVRDSRLREKDPILGIVNINLVDLFTESSEVTRLWSLQEGIGFGRVNISLLFRAFKMKLPAAELGWDTGTVEILAPITMQLKEGTDSSESKLRSLLEGSKKLTISTTDSTEKIPASEADFDSDKSSMTWKVGGEVEDGVNMLRLPTYNRYATSLTFELSARGSSISGTIKGSKQPAAIAVLWLKDLEDNIEKDVEVPILVGKDLRQLRQNALVDGFTEKTHDYEVVGVLKTRVRMDSGLDPDHESHAKSQARRHAFETYDHIEGEALIAERNSHAMDDGVIDKDEKRRIDQAHKRQLHNRHRGIAGYRPYRTFVWMKEGVKRRVLPNKSDARREPTVKSEA